MPQAEPKTVAPPKIAEIRPHDDDEEASCRTFVIQREDHTLGNALRYIVMKDPHVEFCGYSVPHPSEDKINFRIQTDKTCPAEDALTSGLYELHSAFQVLLDEFEKALERHSAKAPQPMDQS